MNKRTELFDTAKKWFLHAEPTLYVKLTIVLFIIIATFYDIGRHLKFMDNKIAKLVLLVAVVVTLLFELHTGIIFLIAFMMLMIQFNNHIVDDIRNKEMEMFLTSLPAPLSTPADEHDDANRVIPEKPVSIQCDNIKKNEISNCIIERNIDKKSNVDYAVDSKVKPYEVFVKMLTTQEHLDNASNAAILSS